MRPIPRAALMWIAVPTTLIWGRHDLQTPERGPHDLQTPERGPQIVLLAIDRPIKAALAAEPVPGYDSDSGLHRTEFDQRPGRSQAA
jgi:hypothetical protein